MDVFAEPFPINGRPCWFHNWLWTLMSQYSEKQTKPTITLGGRKTEFVSQQTGSRTQEKLSFYTRLFSYVTTLYQLLRYCSVGETNVIRNEWAEKREEEKPICCLGGLIKLRITGPGKWYSKWAPLAATPFWSGLNYFINLASRLRFPSNISFQNLWIWTLERLWTFLNYRYDQVPQEHVTLLRWRP
jgi:hypothetical protein